MATKRVVDPRKLTAAIYARVSTYDQKCDLQLTELHGFAERMGWPVVEYTEKASGKAGSKRPILNKLMADARLRKFDVVLVYKLDRFGRSLKDLIGNIQILDGIGIRFIAPGQGIDTDNRNPISKLMLNIMGAFAEFERDLIVERVKAGVIEAKRQGKHCGREKAIWNRDEARQLRKTGLSIRAIAKLLGRPVMTIQDALKGI